VAVVLRCGLRFLVVILASAKNAQMPSKIGVSLLLIGIPPKIFYAVNISNTYHQHPKEAVAETPQRRGVIYGNNTIQ